MQEEGRKVSFLPKGTGKFLWNMYHQKRQVHTML